jgi:hypothetical protein
MNMNTPFGRAPACERAAQGISLRLDGELSEIEEAQLRQHLAGCGACQALDREVAAFTGQLRALPLVAPGRSVTLPRLRASRLRSLRPLATAAAMVVVVMGSVTSLLSGSGPQREPGPAFLVFHSQLDQIEHATLAHQRIEPRPGVVVLPADTARQRFERQQMAQALS